MVERSAESGFDEHAAGAAQLPPRLRLLCVGPEEPQWTSLVLQLDAEGCVEPVFRYASTSQDALSLLRDESFDCVLVCGESRAAGGHEVLDPVSLVRAVRASGCDEPVVLICSALSDWKWAELCRLDCEVLVSANLWESAAIVPVAKRAISRVELARENRQLALANQRRLLRERDEAEHLLQQQRQILRELEQLARASGSAASWSNSTHDRPSLDAAGERASLASKALDSAQDDADAVSETAGQVNGENPTDQVCPLASTAAAAARSGSDSGQTGDGLKTADGSEEETAGPSPSVADTADPTATADKRPVHLPDKLASYYDQLLRTYVIMGSGSLAQEIAQLAQVLAVAGLTPREALELHLERVECLVRGLGNRSTRHVMARADLLALELVIHLGECYQQRLSGVSAESAPQSASSP